MLSTAAAPEVPLVGPSSVPGGQAAATTANIVNLIEN
jgi:hypothetical protein